MSGRIFLANVGANASHRFASPIFPDRRFEFLPIPETPDIPPPHAVRYRDLRSHYRPSEDLLRYIPKRLWDRAAHNDPEFETFTYGDNCETTPRGASLKQLEQGDLLFFIARMEEWNAEGPTKRYGFYLAGYLEISDPAEGLRDVQMEPTEILLKRFRNNAHVRRGVANPENWDRFWAFFGSDNSRRFAQAVPVTRDLCEKAFRTADGSPWRWDEHRSELQVIGSYTRSCRCVIDPSLPDGGARADAFWEWVAKHDQG
ncbi:MAG: hypothetical protein QF898_01770 [SAR202 cluster bacterium]|jgi:hypothetical protein|nr:hypothetical protein [SAR202 cluster bacterium]MDP6512508.1 hypothetical protein [SAR202 cluster bacterium]MDP6713148.1 hypothetical protein [SAR202 cluster bacterium]